MRKIDYSKLNKLTEKTTTFEKDERIFSIKTNKEGSAGAIIRFLPAHPKEDLPRVKVVRHYWEEVKDGNVIRVSFNPCPSSIGHKCPICDKYWQMWRAGHGKTPEAAKYRPSESYYLNALIVKNPAEPELEGKVMIVNLNRPLFEKITKVLAPDDGVTEPGNPFDYEKGMNFKYIGKPIVFPGKDGQEVKTLDFIKNSMFDVSSPINLKGVPLTEAEIEKIDSQLYELTPFISDEKIWSAEKIKETLEKKLGYYPLGGTGEVIQPKEIKDEIDLIEPKTESEVKVSVTHTETPKPAPKADVSDEEIDVIFDELN